LKSQSADAGEATIARIYHHGGTPPTAIQTTSRAALYVVRLYLFISKTEIKRNVFSSHLLLCGVMQLTKVWLRFYITSVCFQSLAWFLFFSYVLPTISSNNFQSLSE